MLNLQNKRVIKNADVTEILEKIASEVKVKLLQHKAYSNHPEDDYLHVVLCEGSFISGGKRYITWIANTKLESFNHGHYFESYFGEETAQELYDKALADFHIR